MDIWNYGTDEDVTTGVKTPQRRAGAGWSTASSASVGTLATTRALSDTLADHNRFTAGLGAGYTMVKTDNVLFLASGPLLLQRGLPASRSGDRGDRHRAALVSRSIR